MGLWKKSASCQNPSSHTKCTVLVTELSLMFASTITSPQSLSLSSSSPWTLRALLVTCTSLCFDPPNWAHTDTVRFRAVPRSAGQYPTILSPFLPSSIPSPAMPSYLIPWVSASSQWVDQACLWSTPTMHWALPLSNLCLMCVCFSWAWCQRGGKLSCLWTWVNLWDLGKTCWSAQVCSTIMYHPGNATVSPHAIRGWAVCR